MSNKVKYLHLMRNDKFLKAYIEFINKNLDKNEHKFIIIDGADEREIPFPKYSNVKPWISKGKRIKNTKIRYFLFLLQYPFLLLYLLMHSIGRQQIYFHGLFDPRNIIFLFIFRFLLKKSNWCMWGGDLYCYENRNYNLLKNRIWYRVEDYVKGNFYGYITQIKGDYKLAKLWYRAKGNYFYSFMYPSNMYKAVDLIYSKESNNYLNIQIGNSADSSNNHLEILEKLKKYKNIKIYCPLSYGDSKYAKYVGDKGKEIFGDNFIPMFDFLEYNEYLKFLSTIDIAIFAHNRQQAVGNIMSLLSLKKTVYLKEKVTTYEMLQNLGVVVKSFDKFDNLEKLDENILLENKEIIKKRFSKERLIEDLTNLFND